MRAGCLRCFATNSRAPCENTGMNSAIIVQKVWNYCKVLRDDGMSYGDYVEQPTYILKMADERSRPPYKQPSLIPAS